MLLIGLRLSRVHVMELKCKQIYERTERNLTKVLRTWERFYLHLYYIIVLYISTATITFRHIL
jgi:hypothetical protein